MIVITLPDLFLSSLGMDSAFARRERDRALSSHVRVTLIKMATAIMASSVVYKENSCKTSDLSKEIVAVA